MDIKALITKHLPSQHMMQLATFSGKQPWCCSVYFITDELLNFYWASLPTRRHSLEIEKNNKVAVAIAINYAIGEKVIGIQVEGSAKVLTKQSEIKSVATAYAKRFNRTDSWISDMTNNKTSHKLYKLTPSQFVVFDELNFPDDPRRVWQP